jgi:hypothetical protein
MMSFLPRVRNVLHKNLPILFLILAIACSALLIAPTAHAQTTGALRGRVADPTGALIPGASVALTQGSTAFQAVSGKDGVYSFRSVPVGSYTLVVDAPGFAQYESKIILSTGQTREFNISLAVASEQQNVTVTSQSAGVSTNSEENASTLVIKGGDLDALSDDPDELQNELQALAGPSAGPNGGEIYIDGFSGGQIPPKSSIREIRVNQNPFSAEFDRIGYGRIEILTKPGSDKFSGHVTSLATDSAWDTGNALIPHNQQQPSYYLNFIQADVNGPLDKHASYFFSMFRMNRQNESIIDAINPANTGASIIEPFPNPSSFLVANPRVDFQLGANNTLSIRDSFSRSVATGNGPGQLSLPEQAFNVHNTENDLQVSDTVVVNSHLLNETHFQWRRIRNGQTPSYATPTVTVQGAFTTGGSNSGVSQDHQDDFELQNYSTTTVGAHSIRFGTRLRSYRDANYSTSGANGNYLFTSVAQYLAATPSQYQATVFVNPLARALLFDGALFYQDEWHFRPNLTFSDGLRFETQNRIHDHADWAPRLALAWAPWHSGTKPPKTVIRAGYGWFYNRFTVPNSFNAASTPYILQAIHQNGINQHNYVVNNPSFYNPNQAASPSTIAGASSSTPTVFSVDRHFHSAVDMQGGVGIDQQIHKMTFNVTYLFTRGVHQYLTDNITAPIFDSSTYTLNTLPPSVYNYQFQSGGIYNQQQVIVTANAQIHHLSLHGNYTYNDAKSDTQGAGYVPSDSQHPGLDYGRANFGITNRLFLLGTYSLPHAIILAPLLAAQSGTPYNITTGSDLTGNNQFNARPTYGVCGAADVVSTPYGCLDSAPTGKNEQIIPYGLGTGPANFVMHIRVSKAIGIGPRIKGTTGMNPMQGGGGGVGGRGLSGSQAQVKLDASVPRRYNLTLIAGAMNMFNIVNRGAPNGTLSSPLFGKSQSLANGPFGSPTPGNRSIIAQATFAF